MYKRKTVFQLGLKYYVKYRTHSKIVQVNNCDLQIHNKPDIQYLMDFLDHR